MNTYCWQVLIFLFLYCGKEHVTENLPLTSIFSTQSRGTGFLGGTVVRNPRKHRLHLSVRKIPWRSKWQPTAVFLLGWFRGQRSLVDCSPGGHDESDTTERQSTHAPVVLSTFTLLWNKSPEFSHRADLNLYTHQTPVPSFLLPGNRLSSFCFCEFDSFRSSMKMWSCSTGPFMTFVLHLVWCPRGSRTL